MVSTYAICGIGQAIVDCQANVAFEFLESRDIDIGSMSLVDENEAIRLRKSLDNVMMSAGGSCANSIVTASALGSKCCFIGKVSTDEAGIHFKNSLRDIGCTFSTPPASEGPSTGQCIVCITPDGERTMKTYLGVSGFLYPCDLDEAAISGSQIRFITGYLWNCEFGKETALRAIDIAKGNNRMVALSLSAVFVVERFRPNFIKTLPLIDILFGNESELRSLFECDSVDMCMSKASEVCKIVCVTVGDQGVMVDGKGLLPIFIPAFPVNKVVDCTGSGDSWAGAFMHYYLLGSSILEAATFANVAASMVIGHFGARPKSDFKSQMERYNSTLLH